MIPNRSQPFVVIGSARSGTGLLRSSIDSHPHATCLGELLHADHEEVRKANHFRYFQDEDWLKLSTETPNKKIAIRYLEQKIWPEAESEHAFGFKLLFWQIDYFQLWSYLSKKAADLKIIYTTRNPIAVFVSLEQAKIDQQWIRQSGEKAVKAEPVKINMNALDKHIQKMLEHWKKIVNLAVNICEVEYEDLVKNYQGTMNRVYDFLDLKTHQAVSSISKQQDWDIKTRILNFEKFSKKLKVEYRAYLENML
jgi:LPS sulfotransferase NodH